MNLAAVIVSVLSLLVGTYSAYRTYGLNNEQRRLQERLTKVEEDRNRYEKRDRWLRLNPLPVIYTPVSGVDGYKVRVANQGGADATIALNISFTPPGGGGFSHGLRSQEIKGGEYGVFDVSEPMSAYQNNGYTKSLAAGDRMATHKYLRLHAFVENGPKVDAYTYGTEHGAWVQAGWEVVREAGGAERVESILPPPDEIRES